MAEPLKNTLNRKFLETISNEIQKNHARFNKKSFVRRALSNDWQSLELKERITRICQSLHQELPPDYRQAIAILMPTSEHFSSYEALFFPEFVGRYGREKKNLALSKKALLHFTRLSTSEFAVRPFIEDNLEPMMAWMQKLSTHKDYHIRRLASEGCRPRLPWAGALNDLKKDPQLILPILENLKNDSELYVRKSVANNLNDISKDHPKVAIALAKKWLKGKPTEETQWIVKHGMRTLIKKGDHQVLNLFGFSHSSQTKINQFKITSKKVKLGDSLAFQIQLKNESNKAYPCVVDFVIHHLKKNGQHQPKVFKLKTIKIPAKETLSMEKNHKMAKINTRKYYPGPHFVSLLVNGKESQKIKFTLES